MSNINNINNININNMNMDLIKKTDYIYHSHSTLQRDFSMMQQEFLNFKGEFNIVKRENTDLRIQNQNNHLNEININHLIERCSKLESSLAHCQSKIYHLEIHNSKQDAVITNYKRHYLMCSFNQVENRNLDNNRVLDNRVADNSVADNSVESNIIESNIEGLTKNDDDKVLANIWDNVHKGNRPWNIIIPHSPDHNRGFYNSNSPDHNRRNFHSPDHNHRNNRNANNHRTSRNPRNPRNPES